MLKQSANWETLNCIQDSTPCLLGIDGQNLSLLPRNVRHADGSMP